ncbi:alpha/beta fold hydrolase [Streptomyces sp. NPDC029704]|uniref:alpha/beta hydrolase n=1 Tax=Streptomyces TaxID=1883 RepID=UPI0033D71765
MAELETECRSLDGTALVGTVTPPSGRATGLAVLAHGAGVTRHEGGLFTRIAAALAGAGIQCLRFDLRAHGSSGGRPQDITIAAVANDIKAAADHLRAESGLRRPVHLIAASFSGGAAALHAAHRPTEASAWCCSTPGSTTASGTSPAVRTPTPAATCPRRRRRRCRGKDSRSAVRSGWAARC